MTHGIIECPIFMQTEVKGDSDRCRKEIGDQQRQIPVEVHEQQVVDHECREAHQEPSQDAPFQVIRDRLLDVFDIYLLFS